jgi:hypothetical protein
VRRGPSSQEIRRRGQARRQRQRIPVSVDWTQYRIGLRVNVAWSRHVPAKLPELWLGFEGSTLYLVVASKAKIPEPFPHGAQENPPPQDGP